MFREGQALGYSDASKAIRVHVDSDDRGVDEMATPGGTQKVVIINESGLYALILSSYLELAQKCFCRQLSSALGVGSRVQGVEGRGMGWRRCHFLAKNSFAFLHFCIFAFLHFVIFNLPFALSGRLSSPAITPGAALG
ncbi:MAG: Bro-N domain-containing protein [Bacteroidaceae bacterium]|nr:Bro-N domain-containing protein [Bacteroidaceae bacterium]